MTERPAGADLEALLHDLRRQRSILIAALVFALAGGLLGRVGSRVYAVAVRDEQSGRFVEQVYLAQAEQVAQARQGLIEQARLAHPYYREIRERFYSDATLPGFAEPMVTRRVRRLRCLPAGAKGSVEAPVRDAIAALTPVAHVTVNAVGLVEQATGRVVVVLPDKAMADQAQRTRKENVARAVQEQLNARAGDRLERTDFLQQVELKPGRYRLAEVKTVKEAVDYLTRGGIEQSMHEVQTGETANRIAAKYGATVAQLAEWNGGRDLTRVQVGEKLLVRHPEAPLTVVTVERRSYEEGPRGATRRVTVQVVRHDGVVISRNNLAEQPVTQ